MDEQISRIAQLNQEKQVQALQQQRDVKQDMNAIDLQETVLRAFQTLTNYLENRVSKTVVLNQLEEIGTPDAFKVVEAVENLHATLKTHENTDLTEVTELMRALLKQAQDIPKEHQNIDIPKPVDHSKEFKKLTDAVNAVEKVVKAQELIAEAPQVNVEAPEVKVEPPDLKPLEKHYKSLEKAVKSIVIPEVPKTDLSKVEKELRKQSKSLSDIAEYGLGGGAEGSSSIAPFLNDSDQLPVAAPNLIDTNNSSTTPLGAGATFTGTGTDVSQYAAISVFVYSDQDSATDGFKAQFSSDGTNWDEELVRTYTNGSAADKNLPVNAQYFRVVFTNGATPQTDFRLQTILHTAPLPSEPDRLSNEVNPEKDAQLTKSAIIAQASGAGNFVPIQSTNGGSLKISLEEAEGILGQANMASSIPVTIASDQTATEYALRIDDTTTANVTYIGKAAIGSATSSAVWQVQKLDETTGTIKTWADGNASFDNIWDNRASLSYA